MGKIYCILIIYFYFCLVKAQLNIQFEIKNGNVEDTNSMKNAIQDVSGVEPIINTQTVVLGINYVPGVCQPGYYWSNVSTCELCSCFYTPSFNTFTWFEPL
jgi:hypothetical protein